MSRKLIKVIHFIHGFNTGGAETLVKNYVLNANRGKFNVVVLCLEHVKDSPYEKVLRDSGVRVICVEDYLLFGKSRNLVARLFNKVHRYVIVRRILKKESPNIIHSHLLVNEYIKNAHPRTGTSIVYTVHSKPQELWFNGKKGRQSDFNSLKWLVGHYKTVFIVLHEQMKNEVERMFGVSNAIILNNGVDVKRIKNAKSTIEMRKELGIPEDAFVIGHIGRFSSVKNQSFLIDVLSNIIVKKKNAFLLMVGDGPDKKVLTEKLQKKKLEGRYLILSNRDDIPDILNTMDYFVFPSLYEGLPLSLIEAQIAEKPCFISDSINSQATISNLVTRLSLDAGAERWASCILNYKKPVKIEVNSHDWDIALITKELESIYLTILEEDKNGKK